MAGSAAEIKLLEYKDTITQLNTLLTAQTELNRSLQKTVKDLRQDNKNLMEQIDYLTKKLFGTSSEKSKDIEGQLCLFDEAEQAADPQETFVFLFCNSIRYFSITFNAILEYFIFEFLSRIPFSNNTVYDKLLSL